MITNIINSVKDSELAKLHLSGPGGDIVHVDCIFKESKAPNFLLVFPPTSFPTNLKTNQNCKVSIYSEDKSTVLSAAIVTQIDDRTIELKAHDTIDPISLREYFRVLYQTSIQAIHKPSSSQSNSKRWKLDGTTIDLSGTGVLAIFSKEFTDKRNIFIQFQLNESGKIIECISRVVRTRRIRKGRYQIALHFDNISDKNRDAVITACLQEQRRQLRLRMQG